MYRTIGMWPTQTKLHWVFEQVIVFVSGIFTVPSQWRSQKTCHPNGNMKKRPPPTKPNAWWNMTNDALMHSGKSSSKPPSFKFQVDILAIGVCSNWYFCSSFWNTADGRNPAPVHMVNLPATIIYGFLSISGGAGFLPSTVPPSISHTVLVGTIFHPPDLSSKKTTSSSFWVASYKVGPKSPVINGVTWAPISRVK